MYSQNSSKLIFIDVPTIFTAQYGDINQANIGTITLLSADKKYLPRATLVYSPYHAETPTKDSFRAETASLFPGVSELTIKKYRGTKKDRLIHGFSAIITHSKYEALWSGDMVFLSTLLRYTHEDQVWSITLTAQLRSADAEGTIIDLQAMLLNINLASNALAKYQAALPARS